MISQQLDSITETHQKDKEEHKTVIDNKNKEISDIKQEMDDKVTHLNEENKKCHQELEKCQQIVSNNDRIATYFYNQVKGTNQTLDQQFELAFNLSKEEDRKLINIFKYVRLPQLKKIWIAHPQNVNDQNSIKQFMVSN